MQGCVYRNGVTFNETGGNFQKDSAYIMQDDHLSPLISVKEYMETAANLKLGGMSEKAKANLVSNILVPKISIK